MPPCLGPRCRWRTCCTRAESKGGQVKKTAVLLIVAMTWCRTADALAQSQTQAAERLGTVNFEVSCSAAARASFSRGVALLHDFWYDEAKRQFEHIAQMDPTCAMAHWGVAMSIFHQIWDRPDEETMAQGLVARCKRRRHPAQNRARARVRRGTRRLLQSRQAWIMKRECGSILRLWANLYRRYPKDTDAGAFYALSLLAAEGAGRYQSRAGA